MRRRFPYGLILLLLVLISSVVTDAVAAPAKIRTANSRAQVDPNLALPPVPMPDPTLSGPAPGPGPTPLPPMPSNNPTFSPIPPVPPPDPGGAQYTVPFGTMREREIPPKQYMGDPGGFGSGTGPGLGPVPLDPNALLPQLDPNATGPTTDRFGVAPPPGTLGQTYHRRSRILDVKKHPRAGIVEVHLSENYDVSAKGLKSKWTGKVWELESDPLLPGIPHIFEVTAEWGPEGAKRREVRVVRLIMGRVVELDF